MTSYIQDIEKALEKHGASTVKVERHQSESHYMADLIFPDGTKVIISIPKKYNNLWPIRWERAVLEALELVK